MATRRQTVSWLDSMAKEVTVRFNFESIGVLEPKAGQAHNELGVAQDIIRALTLHA